MSKNILLLDLDGVLITTPGWKSDEIAADGYSAFNAKMVSNLNVLLSNNLMDIWLISSRRKGVAKERMNYFFANRGVCQTIEEYVPIFEDHLSRKSEVDRFVEAVPFDNMLILDDDSSLRGLNDNIKKNWVEINSLKGFNKECLATAMNICSNW
jgi:hypothetical protein